MWLLAGLGAAVAAGCAAEPAPSAAPASVTGPALGATDLETAPVEPAERERAHELLVQALRSIIDATEQEQASLLEERLAPAIDASMKRHLAEATEAQAHERQAILASMDLMRLETLTEVQCALQEALASAAPPRSISPEGLDQLVADAIHAIDQQRTATVGEVAAIVDSATADAFGRTERLVDLVFWRLLALLGAAFAAVLLVFLLAGPRRRRADAPAAPAAPAAQVIARPELAR